MPFSFLFDESASSQLKKLYDGYVLYWSKRFDSIIHSYCGLLFVGQASSEDLVEHHKTFKEGFIFRFQSSFVFWKGWVQCQFSFEEKLGDKLLP